MDDFLARIGLGCGRLAGGVAERRSRLLLEAAIDCGIRYFDTAPAYGGGRSEHVLGSALSGMRSEVRVCTKVGLARPTPTLKSEARTVLAAVARRALPHALMSRLRGADAAARQGGTRHYGRFDADFVRGSVEQSLAALRTDRLDAVLLHEPRLSDPPPEARQVLDALVTRGSIGQLGTGSARGADELPQFGRIAQCTVAPSLPADGREWVVHGLMRDFDPAALERALSGSGLLEMMPSLRGKLSSDQRGAGLLLCSVLIGVEPSRVLLSTHSPNRLRSLLTEGRQLYADLRAQPAEPLKSRLASLVRAYLDGRRSTP